MLMKTSTRFAAAGLVFAGTLALGQAAVAEPSVQLVAGQTTVRLSTELVEALGSLGVTPDSVAPGGLHPTDDGALAVFPIPTGELDSDGPVVEFIHSGGLTLTAGDTRVALTSFIIENMGNTLRLSGVVKANDTIVGRIALFRVELTQAPEVTGDPASGVGILRIQGANLTLTNLATTTLNTAFGLDDVFTAGFPIGTARIYARIRDLDG
jgi:hypothetical protein